MMGYGWGLGAGGWIAMTIFWVGVIALIVWLITRALPGSDKRRNDSPWQDPPRGESAREILDGRYAAGEIDRAAYESMREALGLGRPQQGGDAR